MGIPSPGAEIAAPLGPEIRDSLPGSGVGRHLFITARAYPLDSTSQLQSAALCNGWGIEFLHHSGNVAQVDLDCDGLGMRDLLFLSE